MGNLEEFERKWKWEMRREGNEEIWKFGNLEMGKWENGETGKWGNGGNLRESSKAISNYDSIVSTIPSIDRVLSKACLSKTCSVTGLCQHLETTDRTTT